MATLIGTNVVTALANRYVVPNIVDMIYQKTPLTFRLVNSNRKVIKGGTQIELPWMYQRFSAGGSYSGFDLLTMAPADTVRNGALDWKQYYVPLVIDGLTLIKMDQPEAVADVLRVLFQQAEMEMVANLAAGLFNGLNGSKDLDGLVTAINNTGVYATIDRAQTANAWLRSQVNSTLQAMTIPFLNSFFQSCSRGGSHPTIVISGADQYNRFYNLAYNSPSFNFNQNIAGGADEVLADLGFTNLMFNNVPWVIDDYAPVGNGANTQVFFLNENFLEIAVSGRGDFAISDFDAPANQDAYLSKLTWAGNLLCTNPAVQGRVTGFNA